MKAPPEETSEFNFFQSDADSEVNSTTDVTADASEESEEEETSQEIIQEVIEELDAGVIEEEAIVTEEQEPTIEVQEQFEEENPAVEESPAVADSNVRRIYGKITLASTGENLAGVNIMVPGSSVAKISNNIGGYTIQVPQGTRELVFIYRGKKMVQRLSASNNLLNVRLNLETMEYD